MKIKNKYAIKRSVTGLGMFAQQDIPRKTEIIQYLGTIITNEEADRTGGRYVFYLNETHSIDGKSRENLARYINHSCVPNAAAYTDDEEVWIISEKAIKAGEEITINYGKEYFASFIQPIGCKCKKCSSRK